MLWEQLTQSSLEQIESWAEEQPWCQAMADCIQDPQWHAEGDVWTHTKLVLRQLLELEEWPQLARRQQVVLIFTALFHDAAKPLTTEIVHEVDVAAGSGDPGGDLDGEAASQKHVGRVRSPKHAVKGEGLARNILRELGCDLATREEIARLVRYHGRPAFLLERAEPTHEVVRLSWLVNNHLLYLFALADTRGRDTDSMTRPEENLHYWKLVAEEADCFHEPYSFATPHARFTFFRQQSPNLHYVPHEEFSCTATMVAGLPGSGKDTWLQRHQPDHPIVSLDAVRRALGIDPNQNQGVVAQHAQEKCRELLRAGADFAFNATNTLPQTRQRWLNLFADYNARIEIVYLEPPFATLLRQNSSREHRVPEKVIRKLAQTCAPPTWLECHQLTLREGV